MQQPAALSRQRDMCTPTEAPSTWQRAVSRNLASSRPRWTQPPTCQSFQTPTLAAVLARGEADVAQDSTEPTSCAESSLTAAASNEGCAGHAKQFCRNGTSQSSDKPTAMPKIEKDPYDMRIADDRLSMCSANILRIYVNHSGQHIGRAHSGGKKSSPPGSVLYKQAQRRGHGR